MTRLELTAIIGEDKMAFVDLYIKELLTQKDNIKNDEKNKNSSFTNK